MIPRKSITKSEAESEPKSRFARRSRGERHNFERAGSLLAVWRVSLR